MNKSQKDEVIKILSETYPNAKPQLEFNSVYELLIAVILSAQCTDVRVNKVTSVLFKEYNTPEKVITLSCEELEKYIFTCGLYHSKATHILSATKDILEKFGGQVPNNLEDLRTLSGVGRKTANVVYACGFGGDAIAVDTHVFRVSNRIGLAKANNVLETEKQLMQAIDKSVWSKAHHYLIYHGRKVCSSRAPKCEICSLNGLCEYYKKVKK